MGATSMLMSATIVRVYDLEIDATARTVKRAGRTIPLTPREYAVLEFLTLNQGSPVSRSRIQEHVYRDWERTASNVVDVYIRHLRQKIDKDFDPPLILTRWGEGYMLRGTD
jgi:DNA-binding response OmpR family regulator